MNALDLPEAPCYQLGTLAHHRGDYAEAGRQYRRSLEISEELGDRAGMAPTLSQLGVLLTERGNTEDAVGYNVRSLALRLDIGSPGARIDVHWRRQQQELLGEVRLDDGCRIHGSGSRRAQMRVQARMATDTRRKFDRDFQQGAVRLVLETGRPIAQVARELGINEGTLGNWVGRERRARSPSG